MTGCHIHIHSGIPPTQAVMWDITHLVHPTNHSGLTKHPHPHYQHHLLMRVASSRQTHAFVKWLLAHVMLIAGVIWCCLLWAITPSYTPSTLGGIYTIHSGLGEVILLQTDLSCSSFWYLHCTYIENKMCGKWPVLILNAWINMEVTIGMQKKYF